MAETPEEPRYETLDVIDSVEIRHYQASIQAVTELPGNNFTAQGFRRLAGFIFGANDQSMAIAMTAPVQETLGVEKPLMAFTMPGQYDLADLPKPQDDSVRLMQVAARTMAVIRFSGWATTPRVARFERSLRETLALEEIETVSEAVLNQYNPPWTLPFMRRNEIAIEIHPPQAAALAWNDSPGNH